MTSLAADLATKLYVRSAQLPDITNLLSLLPAEGGLAWVHGPATNQHGIVGWDEIARITISGPERFSRAQRWWSQQCAISEGDKPIAFASFAFDKQPGTSVVVIPKVSVKRDELGTTLTITSDSPVTDLEISELIAKVSRPHVLSRGLNQVTWLDGSRPVAQWQAAVDVAVSRINLGELDKVVLARDIVAQLDEPLHIGSLLLRLNEAFPECWTFCVDGLVGATPELLIRRDGEHVTSRVLAGTMRRSRDSDRDGQLAAELLGSDKDQEEHVYAVESVAAALATHCTDLKVPAQPFVLRLANVQHLATDVTGELVDAAPALALAASLHPTAAVCGTPTERATQVIRELEGMDRGRYSAPVGWLAANGDGEFGIALRCALIENAERTKLRLFAGCGIVAGSTGESEVAESQAKFGAMKAALD
ncbi:MAG: isochorismate synthase [Candidatus Nanopelagicales bacterium]|nr:isochorismate synthase [Candidatus Nanopelagicales bacterium]